MIIQPNETVRKAWEIRIEAATPSQNTREGKHYCAKTREKRLWWYLIRAAPGFLEIPKATAKRKLTIERHARGVQQDEANVHGGCKGIVDDLVQHGLLVDDSPQWLEHGTPRHVRLERKQKAHTVLILEEIT